jgi:hypothetical protein
MGDSGIFFPLFDIDGMMLWFSLIATKIYRYKGLKNFACKI